MPCSFSGATTGVGSGSSPSSTPTAPTPLFGFGLNSTAAASGMWHGKFDSSIPMATGAWCPPYVVPCYEDANARYTPYGIPSCGGRDSATNFSFDAEHVRYCGQQQQLPTPNYSAPVQQQQAEILAAAQAQAKEEAEISSRLPREVLNIHRRLDHQQLAVDALQGNLSKLTVMVEQIALAVNSSPSPATSPVLASSSEVPSATTVVAPQVFVEMPTPRYLHVTQATTLNCCSGHQNPILNSCLQSDSTNPTEQYLAGRPQPYGFHNLNRQTVFLADGTECSYFTLPADYPLEQATPPTSHSAVENVDVAAPSSVAAQATGLAPVPCSTTNNTAGSESMLVYAMQLPTVVQDGHNGLKEMHVSDVIEEEQQKIEQLDNCLHKALANAPNEQVPILKQWSSKLKHTVLPVKFWTSRTHIFYSAIMCYLAFGLEWTQVKTAAGLVLVVPCSKGKSVAKHSLCPCQIVTIAGQTLIFPSCPTKSVQVTKHKHPLEFILLAEMMQNVSEFRVGQLSYMPQSPTTTSEFLRHMVTVLSCWLSSFGNRAKLQWDPGISNSSSEYPYTMIFLHDKWKFVHQPGVHENYNAKHLRLSSKHYLQIWQMDIIFITFLPP